MTALGSFSSFNNCSRLIHHSKNVYKVKIQYDIDKFQVGKLISKFEHINQEIEQVLRAVFYMIERNSQLKPIVSKHLKFHVRKVKWDFLSKRKGLVFMKENKNLHVYHDVIELKVKDRKDRVQDQVITSNTTSNQEQTKTVQDNSSQKSPGREKHFSHDGHKNNKRAHTTVSDKQINASNIKSTKTNEDVSTLVRDKNGIFRRLNVQGLAQENRVVNKENVAQKSDKKNALFSPVIKKSPRLKKLPSAEKQTSSHKPKKNITKVKTRKNNETDDYSSTSESNTESDQKVKPSGRPAVKVKQAQGKDETTEESESSDSEPAPKKIKLRQSLRRPNQDHGYMSNLNANQKQHDESPAKKSSNKTNSVTESPRLYTPSPRISTVRPVKRDNPATKRDNSRSALLSPGTASSPVLSSSQRLLRSTTAEDEEMSRVERLRTPQSLTVDSLRATVNSRRDRHSVEQAEREEATKLQRLFEPTRPRNEHGKRTKVPTRSWTAWLWGKE